MEMASSPYKSTAYSYYFYIIQVTAFSAGRTYHAVCRLLPCARNRFPDSQSFAACAAPTHGKSHVPNASPLHGAPMPEASALWLAFCSTSLAPGLSPGWIRAMHDTYVGDEWTTTAHSILKNGELVACRCWSNPSTCCIASGLAIVLRFFSAVLEKFIQHFPSALSSPFRKIGCTLGVSRCNFSLHKSAMMVHVN
jgi:hypothetical protein